MDHDRFSGWDSNVFSTNNDIADNGEKNKERLWKKEERNRKKKDVISILQQYE